MILTAKICMLHVSCPSVRESSSFRVLSAGKVHLAIVRSVDQSDYMAEVNISGVVTFHKAA